MNWYYIVGMHYKKQMEGIKGGKEEKPNVMRPANTVEAIWGLLPHMSVCVQLCRELVGHVSRFANL